MGSCYNGKGVPPRTSLLQSRGFPDHHEKSHGQRMRIKGKVLLLAVCATGTLAAMLTVAQIWFSALEADDFLKSLITMGICGTLFSFLIAIDYDAPAARSKIIFAALVALAFCGSGLIIIQLWWAAFSWSLLGKTLISMIILTALLSFLMVASEDLGQNKKLRDDKYID